MLLKDKNSCNTKDYFVKINVNYFLVENICMGKKIKGL